MKQDYAPSTALLDTILKSLSDFLLGRQQQSSKAVIRLVGFTLLSCRSHCICLTGMKVMGNQMRKRQMIERKESD